MTTNSLTSKRPARINFQQNWAEPQSTREAPHATRQLKHFWNQRRPQGEQQLRAPNKIKPPYNVSALNQKAACKALKKTSAYLKRKNQILKEKEKLYKALNKLDVVQKIYPSQANFFLVKFKNAKAIYLSLINLGIITRDRSNQVTDCLRITVGTKKENQQLINALKKQAWKKHYS